MFSKTVDTQSSKVVLSAVTATFSVKKRYIASNNYRGSGASQPSHSAISVR